MKAFIFFLTYTCISFSGGVFSKSLGCVGTDISGVNDIEEIAKKRTEISDGRLRKLNRAVRGPGE